MEGEVKFDEAQQKFVDKLIGDARIKARAKAEDDFKVTQVKANEEVEKASLAAKNEWQQLAAKHEAKVKELEPLAAQVGAYNELIAGMLKDRIKELGDAAKIAVGALPKSMSDLDKLSWLNANTGLFQGVVNQSVLGTPAGKKKQAGTAKDAAAMGHKRKRL